MSYKRKPKSELSSNSSKRPRRSDAQIQFQATYVTGPSFIPLDDDIVDPDLDVEDSSDAIQYLGTVRDQAKHVPWFLKASEANRLGIAVDAELAQDETDGYALNGIYVAGANVEAGVSTTRDGSFWSKAAVREASQDLGDDESDDDSELIVDIDETQLMNGSEEAEYDDENPWEEDDYQETDETNEDPFDAYRSTLQDRFKRLRILLKPHTHGHTLPKSTIKPRLVYSGVMGGKEEMTWRARMGNTKPRPDDVRNMPESTAIHLLRIFPHLLKRNTLLNNASRTLNISAWAWALLAKISPSDEIAHDDVSVLRELGKKALRVAREVKGHQDRVSNTTGIMMDDSDSESQEGGHFEEEGSDTAPVLKSVELDGKFNGDSPALAFDGDASDTSPLSRHERNTSSPLMSPILRAAKASKFSQENEEEEELERRRTQLLAQIEDNNEADSVGSTRPDIDPDIILTAALDVILTVVGEWYGQGDLLGARDALWLPIE